MKIIIGWTVAYIVIFYFISLFIHCSKEKERERKMYGENVMIIIEIDVNAGLQS